MFGGNINPGDVFLTNDPYHGGHNCTFPTGAISAHLLQGRAVVLYPLPRHQMDTGGSFPGGYFPNGYDIHAEGLIIPPIKVIERGKERKDLVNLILKQCAVL
jgi:N-methylhydantoinase B